MIIKGYRVVPLLRKTWHEIQDDNVFGLAAQTAYYFFFSLFPLLLFTAPLLGTIGDSDSTIAWATRQAERFLPPEAIGLVDGVINDVVFSPNAPGVMSVGALLAAWAASNVFDNLITALNRAYDVDEGRPWWKRRLIALACVLGSGVFLIVASAIMLAGPEIISLIGSVVPGVARTERIWMVVQYPLALAMLIAMFGMIYYFLPNLRQRATPVLAGATVAAVLWVLVTLAFRAYATNFGSYNKTYGTIGAVIVLLTWMYLTMLVVLAAGELSSELHHGTGAVVPRRDAVYAGRVATARQPGRASTDRIERIEPLGAGRA